MWTKALHNSSQTPRLIDGGMSDVDLWPGSGSSLTGRGGRCPTGGANIGTTCPPPQAPPLSRIKLRRRGLDGWLVGGVDLSMGEANRTL